MAGTLLGALLCDELWVCGYAVEDLFNLGNRHAWTICCSNHCKLKKSPENESVKQHIKGGSHE